jgi:hypothetical protein
LKLSPVARTSGRDRRSRYCGRRSIPSLADIGLDDLTLAGLIAAQRRRPL